VNPTPISARSRKCTPIWDDLGMMSLKAMPIWDDREGYPLDRGIARDRRDRRGKTLPLIKVMTLIRKRDRLRETGYLVFPSARRRRLLFVGLAQIAKRSDSIRLQHTVIMFFHQHLGGLFRRPRAGKALRAVGDPESGEPHDGGVAGEQVRLYFVKSIHGGVVRVFVLRRILAHVDAGQTGKNKWPLRRCRKLLSSTSTSPKDFYGL
jgi:hypothetical protein